MKEIERLIRDEHHLNCYRIRFEIYLTIDRDQLGYMWFPGAQIMNGPRDGELAQCYRKLTCKT